MHILIIIIIILSYTLGLGKGSIVPEDVTVCLLLLQLSRELEVSLTSNGDLAVGGSGDKLVVFCDENTFSGLLDAISKPRPQIIIN